MTPTDKLREKAREWLIESLGYDPIYLDTTTEGVKVLASGASLLADVRRMAIEECESKVRAILEDHIDRRQGLLTAAGPILRALKEAKVD